jgi:hypothetical protein
MNKNLGYISRQCFGSRLGAAQKRPAIPGWQRIEGAR